MFWLKILIITVLLTAIGWQSWLKVFEPIFADKPIHYIKVEGVFQYTNKDRLKQVLAPLIKLGYYHTDVEAVQQAIKTLPLVDKVDVKRIWPDAIYIKITEKKTNSPLGRNCLIR